LFRVTLDVRCSIVVVLPSDKAHETMSSSDDDTTEHLQYKVIVMGDGAVGKTSLINRFCQDGFAQSYKQTIGVDFFNKKVQLPGNVNVTMQIWDIGGQQVGGKMLGKYIFGSAAIIYVYDTTNPESFKNLEDWFGFVTTAFKSEKRPYMAVVGNKIDLQHLRQVKAEKHSLFAIEHQMTSHLVSAKTGEKVTGMFMKVAADLAGVQLTKSEVEMSDKVVTASIVQHPAAPVPKGPQGPKKEEEDSGCVVQ
jgi:Ras-related protein Rab-28